MQILCTIGLGVPLSFVVNKLFWWSIVNDFHMGRAGEVMSWLLLSLPQLPTSHGPYVRIKYSRPSGTNDGGDLPCGLAEVDHEAGDQNAMSPSAILIAARPSSTRSTHTPDSPSIEPENTTARESGDHQVAERSYWSAKGT